MSGFFKLHRGWRDNPVLTSAERRDAWLWLIEAASWRDTAVRIKGETIELARGELAFSQRFLAAKWGWSKSRVDRFMADLRQNGMIETRSKIGATAGQQAGQGQSIIKICNYNKYQDSQDTQRGNDVSKIGATAGQQRGKEEEVKKERKKEIGVDLPVWLDREAWDGFVEMRKAIKKPLTERAAFLIVKKLETLRMNGSPAKLVLEQSTMNSWQGVFPVKIEDVPVQVGI